MNKYNYCFRHEDRPAIGHCAFCGQPVCEECRQGAYCKLCSEIPPKSKGKALLLAVLFGWLGVHRYYMGFYFTGAMYTLTLGLFGIGWAWDVIRILCFSTPKIETILSYHAFIDHAIEHGSNEGGGFTGFVKWWFNRRFWLDKYGRPLLPFGKKSLV